MLGKLIKHELSATTRYFLPLFLIAIVLTPITRLTVMTGDFPGVLKFIPIIIVFAYIVSLIVIVCASGLLIVYRFYKSMVTDEGYLMHTLPVSMESHIVAKLVVSSIWIISSFLVIALSIFMMFYTPERFSDMMYGLNSVWDSAIHSSSSFHLGMIIIELVFLVLFGIFTSPLIFYASIAIGQVILKNKVLGSIVGFFIIQFVMKISSAIFMVPFGAYSERFSDTADSIFPFLGTTVFPLSIFFTIITQVIFFGITDYIFKKKLNLE